MKWFSNQKIKILVDEHPQAGEVLAEFGIRCAECTRHNCDVRQIAESEELTMEQEIDLMNKLEKAFGEAQ
jgi:hypothetical protein